DLLDHLEDLRRVGEHEQQRVCGLSDGARVGSSDTSRAGRPGRRRRVAVVHGDGMAGAREARDDAPAERTRPDDAAPHARLAVERTASSSTGDSADVYPKSRSCWASNAVRIESGSVAAIETVSSCHWPT